MTTTTTDENILWEMIERATDPSKDEVDNMAVQLFCMIVNHNQGSLTDHAHELIIKKIKSGDVTVANRAIGILEECMSKGGEIFQKKTNKFAFLNELIALVLDKHDGTPAPTETKKRIMECLMLWTAEYPDKTKIQEAYDSLKGRVNVEHGPPSSITVNSAMGNDNVREQRSSILGKDDLLVAKLLKQGGEENYKKVNLLIQHRFNEEARRTAFICHLKSELKKIESTMELLEQMLDSYGTDIPGEDSRVTMQDLYNTCKIHNEQMARWPDYLGDSEPDFLKDILVTKDLLVMILQRYRNFEIDTNLETEALSLKDSDKHKNKNSNVTLAMPQTSKSTTTSSSDVLSDLFEGQLNPTTSSCETQTSVKDPKPSTLDELSEIFGSIESTSTTEQTKYPTDLLSDFELLEPINVFGNETSNPSTEDALSANNVTCETSKQGFKELREIDKLSEEIFKQSLQNEKRQTTFKKEPEKITLNDLAKDKKQTVLNTNTNGKINAINKENHDDGISILTSDVEPSLDVPLMDNIDNTTDKVNEPESAKPISAEECKNPITIHKPLAEITIDLDELTPLAEGQRMLMDDEDIQVSLNFTTDRPIPHVSVIVCSVTNKSKMVIKDFQFEASVKKPCKVRLLPPTDTKMKPRKPFRPSEPINQVLLLMNTTGKPVDITCIVGYKLGDDPDPVKESIIAKDIPYV
ncbi:ADP-ribosylation factor-binding protein Gga [Haematobia irritans]|uniref:ADP-ribosylation factor-binding protein Gga n=1 Tax=Haematobia irritans TaxID=7368 RepID=UPI003F4F444F